MHNDAGNGFEIKPDNEGKNTGISYNKIITQVQTTVKENLLPEFWAEEGWKRKQDCDVLLHVERSITYEHEYLRRTQLLGCR